MMKRIGYVLVGIGIAAVLHFALHRDQPPDTEQLQREYTAYRHCLQQAGTMRCQMTPQDFVRYYEIKHLLETDN